MELLDDFMARWRHTGSIDFSPARSEFLKGVAKRWHIDRLLTCEGSLQTSSQNILVRRARRLRKVTGNKDLKSAGELQQAEMTGKDIATMTLWRPFELSFTQPIVFLLNLYIVSLSSIIFSVSS